MPQPKPNEDLLTRREQILSQREAIMSQREHAVAAREKSATDQQSTLATRETALAARESAIAKREKATTVARAKMVQECQTIIKGLTTGTDSGLLDTNTTATNTTTQAASAERTHSTTELPLFGVARVTGWSDVRKHKSITLDSTCLVARAARDPMPGDLHVISVMGNEGFTRFSKAYFEVLVVKDAEDLELTIGMTNTPNWWGSRESIALHNEGYTVLDFSVQDRTVPVEWAYAQDDIVGCGVNKQNQLFFTINGRNLGPKATYDFASEWDSWYAMAQIGRGGEIKANFGPNFVYKGKELE